MAIEKYVSTQSAVLLAGAMIALGLYFGLRDRAPAPASIAPSAVGSVKSDVLPSETQRRPEPTPPAKADRTAVKAAAVKDIDRHRPAVIEKCLKALPPSEKLGFDVNVTFDALGKQLVRSIREGRDNAQRGSGECVTRAVPNLEVPAPGETVVVDFSWTLP